MVKRWRSISAGVIVESQVRAIPIGTPVEIRLTDKTKFRGHLYAVEVSGFSLRTGDAISGPLRQTWFKDVKSIKVVQPSHTPVGAWIAVALLWLSR